MTGQTTVEGRDRANAGPSCVAHRVRRCERSRGQVLVIFALSAFVFVGLCAVVVDVAWYWTNNLKVQRAADAAALAGAVLLPSDVTNAVLRAKAESTKNGYTAGGGVTVTPCSDANRPSGCTGGGGNERQLNVTITAPVPMFFMRVFGINTISATRTAKAEYVLPVPMGSPENYYGVADFLHWDEVNHKDVSDGGLMDPNGVKFLTSRGLWGAVITRGGNRQNGDRYSPYNNDLATSTCPAGSPQCNYDPAGYDYTIEVGAQGKVAIFDPTFCAVGQNRATPSVYYGTGDHWIGNDRNAVTTEFSLWDTHGIAYSRKDDTLVATDNGLFKNKRQSDQSGKFGTSQTSSVPDCANDPYHNKWWTIASNLPAGTYRLNVKTSDASNSSTNAENMWSLWVGASTGSPRVYGSGRMAAYNNLGNGYQRFYLAQIAQTYATKTMRITLFDPGDVGGNAYLRVLGPDGNAYHYVNFNYTADNGRSENHVNVIQAAAGGTSYFNNAVLTIDIPLPATYGRDGLTPPGETQPGWWKIEYQVSGGSDTTTWQVNILGNPVHLIVP